MPRKLKVFRTPVGFHDAYVAAPTQKAALEAWGADSNLFARGDAEQVTDPELMKAPLERPGEVVRVLRGSEEEQVEALGKAGAERARNKKAASPAKRRTAAKTKPSRAALDKAKKELEQLEKKQRAELAKLTDEEKKLAQRRREVERSHARQREEAEDRLTDAKSRYERAMEAWEAETK